MLRETKRSRFADGDYTARKGKLKDNVELDERVSEVSSTRDEKGNTNRRLLIDLCKSTHLNILNGGTGEDEWIGKIVCITRYGESTIGYFIMTRWALCKYKVLKF